MKISQAVEAFKIEQQIRGNSNVTLTNYERVLSYFMSYIGKDTNIAEIGLNELRSYYMSLRARELSTVSIQTYIRGLRAFLSWCFQEEYITENLTDKFKLPKAKRRVIDVLTDEEITRLFKYFDTSDFIGLRNMCIVLLMLDSGLRLSEVVSLKVSSVHIAEGYIIVTGKGNKERYVPIGLQCKRYLMRYSVYRDSATGEAPLFVKGTMTAIKINTVKGMFRKLKKCTGIERLRPHLLRHTFATRYLENGGDIYSLQMILGHTSLEMVKKYLHLIPSKTVMNFSVYSPVDNITRKHP